MNEHMHACTDTCVYIHMYFGNVLHTLCTMYLRHIISNTQPAGQTDLLGHYSQIMPKGVDTMPSAISDYVPCTVHNLSYKNST